MSNPSDCLKRYQAYDGNGTELGECYGYDPEDALTFARREWPQVVKVTLHPQQHYDEAVW